MAENRNKLQTNIGFTNSSRSQISSKKNLVDGIKEKNDYPNLMKLDLTRNKSENSTLQKFNSLIVNNEISTTQLTKRQSNCFSFLNQNVHEENNTKEKHNPSPKVMSFLERKNRSTSKDFISRNLAPSSISLIKKPEVNLLRTTCNIENDLNYYFKYLSPTKKVKYMRKQEEKVVKKCNADDNFNDFNLNLLKLKSNKI